MTDTEDRLREIRERWEAATPGPWEDVGTIDGGEHGCTEVVSADCSPCGWSGCSGARVVAAKADRAAIAAAPSDVAYLLAEIDRLRPGLTTAYGEGMRHGFVRAREQAARIYEEGGYYPAEPVKSGTPSLEDAIRTMTPDTPEDE